MRGITDRWERLAILIIVAAGLVMAVVGAAAARQSQLNREADQKLRQFAVGQAWWRSAEEAQRKSMPPGPDELGEILPCGHHRARAAAFDGGTVSCIYGHVFYRSAPVRR